MHDGPLLLSQYDYVIEYRKTTDHGNADALSRLPAGTEVIFDREEAQADTSTVCLVKQVSLQLDLVNPKLLPKESTKDPGISSVMRYVKEGWPQALDSEEVKRFKKLKDSLSTESGCLFHGTRIRIVIPRSLGRKVLDLIHLGRSGMQQIKQLPRTAVYGPHIDDDVEQLGCTCKACAEHQCKPPKPANHPWVMAEKFWSRLHLDHAINFLGRLL